MIVSLTGYREFILSTRDEDGTRSPLTSGTVIMDVKSLAELRSM